LAGAIQGAKLAVKRLQRHRRGHRIRLTGSKRVLEMSADIINLRRARKAKERREAEATASENRANFGRAKAERQASRAEKDLAARRLDANRREPSGDEPPK